MSIDLPRGSPLKLHTLLTLTVITSHSSPRDFLFTSSRALLPPHLSPLIRRKSTNLLHFASNSGRNIRALWLAQKVPTSSNYASGFVAVSERCGWSKMTNLLIFAQEELLRCGWLKSTSLSNFSIEQNLRNTALWLVKKVPATRISRPAPIPSDHMTR